MPGAVSVGAIPDYLIASRDVGNASLVSDTFTDVNGTSLDLHTPNASPGTAWVEYSGTWEIQGNEVTQTGGAAVHRVAAIDAGASDVDVTVTFVTIVGADAGLVVRVTDDNNHYMLQILATTFAFYKKEAGAFTLLASASATIANGDVVMVRASGNNLAAFQNEVERVTAVDATFPTQTRHGIRQYSGANSMDSFLIEPAAV